MKKIDDFLIYCIFVLFSLFLVLIDEEFRNEFWDWVKQEVKPKK